MKIKLQTILIMAFLLALQPAYAQYAGGDGRGDFALTAAGLKILSCSNPTNGGTIGTAQQICTGSTPAAFTSLTLPSDYNGVLTYKWQYATVADSTSFTDIANTDSVAYAPGTLTATTWYRRLSRVSCKADWTGATSSNVVKIIVAPTTVGGSVSGDTLVCYGSNSTLLTLSGQTGSVLKWQYSTDDATWNDIASHTATTYTAEDLIVDTWYRAVVQSGVCLVENSDSHKISVFTNYKISGYAKYENNPKTPLSGLKVLLMKGNALVDSVATTTAGYYEFDNLTNGNFGLVIKSAHPSGLWQTWGGVNNTDYLLVSKHIANTLPLPVNPPVIQTSASVKLQHPVINNADATAIRQAAKFPTTGFTYFDTTKWVFSGIDASNSLTNFTLSCADITRDIRGLCSGDVNGTFQPTSGYKTATPGLELVNSGKLPLAQEMVFPIRAERDMELGAITLMLDYDPAQIEITGVEMPENSGVEPWFETLNLEPETLNLLQIGWMSLNPIPVEEGATLLLIHARLTEAFRISHITPQISHSTSENSNLKSEMQNAKSEIRFSLNESPLSELADGDGNVIGGEKLFIPTGGNGEMVKWRNGEIVCYPNPVKDVLNVEFVTCNVDAKTGVSMSLQLVTMHGVVVAKQTVPDIKTGLNKTTMDLRDLPNGAYLLKVLYGDQSEVRKVIVNR